MANADITIQGPEEGPEATMSLLDHVRELRSRLFWVAIAVTLGAVIGWTFRNELVKFLQVPYPGELVIRNPGDQLTYSATIAVTVGAMIAFPVIIGQILAFISPGLYPHEKRWIWFAVPFGLILFASGSAFAYYVMLQPMIAFLTGILTGVKIQLDLSEYITFVTGVLFWMGVAFEMPVVAFVMAKFNVINARMMTRYWRYAIVGIAVIAAVITPTPDPVNMGIVMVPLIVLYGFSIVLVFLARRGSLVPAMLDPTEFDKDAPSDSTGP
jgi:sec-independent protein translocase protein TatC